MTTITILTSPQIPPKQIAGSIGILLEHAPDSDLSKKYPHALTTEKLIGAIEPTRCVAGELAMKLLANEPLLRGVPQLAIFREVVTQELQKALHLIHLQQVVNKLGYQICEFVTPSWWADGLIQLKQLTQSDLQVKVRHSAKKNKFIRSLQRLMSSRFSWQAVYDEWRTALDQLDPFRFRIMLFHRKQPMVTAKHKLWFYTTAVNYTAIGLGYEEFFPEKFHYLVENPHTGGKPLQQLQRKFSNVYCFADLRCVPKAAEVQAAADIITHHLRTVSLTGTEALARDALLQSAWLQVFFKKLLPKGLFSSAVFARWLETVAPRALVVGNASHEAYALYLARAKKIPTLLLQHGVVSNYDRYLEYPVDHYVVRGAYFYERLSPASKRAAVILSPPAPKATVGNRNAIIFLTTPLHLRYMALEADSDAILQQLLQAMAGSNKQLIIRVHPLERISDYQKRINQLLTHISSSVDIQYDQGNPLDAGLARAAAVITFGSTAFIDCLRYAVPIIAFDWIDIINDSVRPYDIFYFAKDLADFEYLLGQAVHDELLPKLKNADLFSTDLSIEEIKSSLKSAIA